MISVKHGKLLWQSWSWILLNSPILYELLWCDQVLYVYWIWWAPVNIIIQSWHRHSAMSLMCFIQNSTGRHQKLFLVFRQGLYRHNVNRSVDLSSVRHYFSHAKYFSHDNRRTNAQTAFIFTRHWQGLTLRSWDTCPKIRKVWIIDTKLDLFLHK